MLGATLSQHCSRVVMWLQWPEDSGADCVHVTWACVSLLGKHDICHSYYFICASWPNMGHMIFSVCMWSYGRHKKDTIEFCCPHINFVCDSHVATITDRALHMCHAYFKFVLYESKPLNFGYVHDVCVYACTYTRTCTCMCMYTHTHTHTASCMLLCRPSTMTATRLDKWLLVYWTGLRWDYYCIVVIGVSPYLSLESYQWIYQH